MAEAGSAGIQNIHLKQSPVHLIAILLAAVAAADLATGQSNQPILPSAIGNLLTQQIDFLLLIVAAALLLFIS